MPLIRSGCWAKKSLTWFTTLGSCDSVWAGVTVGTCPGCGEGVAANTRLAEQLPHHVAERRRLTGAKGFRPASAEPARRVLRRDPVAASLAAAGGALK